MHKSILLAILPLAAVAADAQQSWPLVGAVTQECAVAVAVRPMLYSSATRGRPDALWSELRVRDSKDRDVPYVAYRPKGIPSFDVMTASKVATDEKAKKTIIETPAFGMPVTALAVNARDRNFSRRVSVLRRIDGRWHPLASGRISAVNLPGEKGSHLEVSFGREAAEEEYRIEIENLDNPPLDLGDMPVTLKVASLDIAFIASPGEKYSLAVVNGAERPRYDDNLLGYIDRVRDTVRFEVDLPTLEELQTQGGPTAIWITSSGNIIPFVSVLVFAALGLICIRLIKSTSSEAD